MGGMALTLNKETKNGNIIEIVVADHFKAG